MNWRGFHWRQRTFTRNPCKRFSRLLIPFLTPWKHGKVLIFPIASNATDFYGRRGVTILWSAENVVYWLTRLAGNSWVTIANSVSFVLFLLLTTKCLKMIQIKTINSRYPENSPPLYMYMSYKINFTRIFPRQIFRRRNFNHPRFVIVIRSN